MQRTKWVFLILKVPAKPTSKKVYIWRKLKKLGALALQDAVYVLPNTDKTLEQFQWLAEEIIDMDGEATVWESYAVNSSQEKAIINEFLKAVDVQYEKILSDLNEVSSVADINTRLSRLKAITQEYLTIKYSDFFKSNLVRRIDAILEEEQKIINRMKFGSEGCNK